ncbi:MAG: DUF3577 domain-containing protein [Cardiobacteriaceae bacterium]|nr:DUF3577 domain-containing protein [Cardiobacteriaceae bacterium]
MNNNSKFFDSVMYGARMSIKEITLVSPNKGKQYCSVKGAIITLAEGGKPIYREIDLIVRGDAAKKILWRHQDAWPKFSEKEGKAWFADINVGSLSSASFRKKDGTVGACLKGRLLKITALQIGKETVFGQFADTIQKPLLVTPCYVNFLDVAKKEARVSMLDGKTDEPTYHNINLVLDEVEVFTLLETQGMAPRGWQYKNEDTKVFAILEIADFRAEGFEDKDKNPKSCLRGSVAGIRYLKAGDSVLVGRREESSQAA